jgi:hypothetical protein
VIAPKGVNKLKIINMEQSIKTTVLSEAIKLLGWSGGTIHQVKAEIEAMQPMERGVYLNKLKYAIKHDDDLFRVWAKEYSPLRISHLKISSL